MAKMENRWTEFLHKRVKIIFEDGKDHYSRKVGTVKEITQTHLILKINGETEALLLNKILRMEVLG